MKTHLCDAQDDLSALPITSSMYHQHTPFPQANVATIANMVAQIMLADQSHIDHAYAASYHNMDKPAPVPPAAAPPVPDPFTDTANSL